MAKEMTIRTHDNLGLYVKDWGGPNDRIPLIGLHGITRNGNDFARLALQLSEKERLITIDFRGRGQSDWDPNYQNYHPVTYVQDVLTVMTALNLHDVILVGTSLGGIVSMGLAIARPAALKGIVLNDIGPAVNACGITKLLAMFAEQPAFTSYDHAAKGLRNSWQHAFPTETDMSFWQEFAHNICHEREGAIRPNYDPGIGRAVLEGVGVSHKDPWKVWGALTKIPTLLIQGALSEFLTQETVEEMKRTKPDLSVTKIDYRGHTPTLDEPESLAALTTFFNQANA